MGHMNEESAERPARAARAQRHDAEMPCRIWHPRSLRYLAGTTRNLSASGALVSFAHAAPLAPGERIRIGLPAQAGAVLVRACDFVEGTVVRCEGRDGRLQVAIAFA
jgi:hypothetical protein